MTFQSRRQAGRMLAEQLLQYQTSPNLLVLGLPRGGIPVAYEVAKTLHAPLDALLVRKLGVPGNEELAMGAIAMGDVVYLNQDIINRFDIRKATIQSVIKHEQETLTRRNQLYRHGQPAPNTHHKTIILVDDGLATGATMHAAIDTLRQQSPAKIIVAVPVAPHSTYVEMQHMVDAIICLETPDIFYGVGAWYEDFSQTSDDEVCELLTKASQRE